MKISRTTPSFGYSLTQRFSKKVADAQKENYYKRLSQLEKAGNDRLIIDYYPNKRKVKILIPKYGVSEYEKLKFFINESGAKQVQRVHNIEKQLIKDVLTASKEQGKLDKASKATAEDFPHLQEMITRFSAKLKKPTLKSKLKKIFKK